MEEKNKDTNQTTPAPLLPDQLYSVCDPKSLAFETTEELEELEVIGQDRALAAVQFGIGMPGRGYNLYVLGPPGTDKHAVVRQLLRKEAANSPRPSDWCYVNNFSDSQKPSALRLPAGKGVQLKQDIAQLVDELQSAIPAAFESEEYRNRVAEIEQEYEEAHAKAMEDLRREAEAENIRLIQTPQGYTLAPLVDGQVIDERLFSQLPEAERGQAEEKIARFSRKLRDHLEQLPVWHRERRQKIKELDRQVTISAVGILIKELKAAYAELPAALEYFEAVEKDILDNAHEFRKKEELPFPLPFLPKADRSPSFARYEVNVLVDHNDGAGAPIVYEPNPTYQALIGRIEHASQFGALVTDFRMIKPGALHRAIGGYLILDADRMLLQPYVWQGLKQALFSGKIRIESLGQMLSIVSTVSLEPEPIPLETKVVIIGERHLYYLLSYYDSDFGELFKVAADFDDRVDRSPENVENYARLVATLARKHDLRPLDRHAVARIIEHSSRLQEDSEKLSTHIRNIADLVRESDYWAGIRNNAVIGEADVDKTIEQQIHRLDRARKRIHEAIGREVILIDTDGEKLAQVNGLSVMQYGEFAFGHPTRITATTRIGEGDVIDIEREVELGGAIHSKGVLIISAFLGARYARKMPLSLHASLVFEQTYGGIEGDSASVAELCALLSAVSGIPIKQSLAVTGSVNQLGRVQVIGGVNEKIEGFFDVCNERGLTGDQGVLIPAENVKHLMLRRDVVEAVRENRFHIYPLRTLDEALSLLTGVDAGERDQSGNFPTGSVNRLVEEGLIRLALDRREFEKSGDGD